MIFSIKKRRFRRDGKVEETRSYYLRQKTGRSWAEDSVGGTPTEAVETTALPKKLQILSQIVKWSG